MKVTSFEQACTVKGYDPATVLPNVAGVPARHQDAVTNFVKLIIIAEAINFDEEENVQWEPDWNDDDEYKYFPWFDLEYHKKNNPSGFRFLDSDFGIADTYSTCGSRLCYSSRANSDYAGQQFVELYRSIMTLPK